jgi:hypothetical protein
MLAERPLFAAPLPLEAEPEPEDPAVAKNFLSPSVRCQTDRSNRQNR